MSDYSALKSQMETRRQELQQKTDRIKADVSQAHSADWSEQAQERENDLQAKGCIVTTGAGSRSGRYQIQENL